ncbi:N-carbamoylsarcosine amidohydrolase [Castellaniella sp. GW247-6E4]|uniref:N-carbamoylsarcosine amidohydrolase n=1 Tax=Castellaniella sp. GW247-6E4 TaxID=3140380 RepID=UPI0033164BD8
MAQSTEENYRGVFDGEVGFGTRPAIVVIDFVRAYTVQGSPLYAEGVVQAIANTVPLLSAARASGIPIIYTKVSFHPSGLDGGLFVRKVPSLRKLVEGEPLAEVDPLVAPQPEDLVIIKNYASAFFGTSLATTLHAMGVDTVILTGCSTSGCIRASSIDGIQHGFRVVVPEECVGDRTPEVHRANLFDINAKYGDVLPRETVVRFLTSVAGS